MTDQRKAGKKMKPFYSEEYYKEFWNKFLVPVPGEDYINLEGELQSIIDDLLANGMPESAIFAIQKIEVPKLIEKCTKLVLKEMQIIKDVEAGKASFGYTTHLQENQHLYDFRTRFEFNCLQLREFKRKYGYA